MFETFEAIAEAAIRALMHAERSLGDWVGEAGFTAELEAQLHGLMVSPGAGALVTGRGISQAATCSTSYGIAFAI
jgi:hypothetical protein